MSTSGIDIHGTGSSAPAFESDGAGYGGVPGRHLNNIAAMRRLAYKGVRGAEGMLFYPLRGGGSGGMMHLLIVGVLAIGLYKWLYNR